MSLFRELGDHPELVAALNCLGRFMARHGDYAAARAHHEEALSICRQVGARDRIAQSLSGLADVARRQADDAAADALYRDALRAAWTIGARSEVPALLESLASTAAARGEPDRAVLLWGAAQTLRDNISLPRPSDQEDDYSRSIQAARAELHEDRFAAAWTRGQRADMDAVIADALQATL